GMIFDPTSVTGGTITVIGPTTLTSIVNPLNVNASGSTGLGNPSFVGPIFGQAGPGPSNLPASLTLLGNAIAFFPDPLTGTIATSGVSPANQGVITTNTIVNPADISIGGMISGAGLPANAIVTGVSSNAITISPTLSGTVAGAITLTYQNYANSVGNITIG